MNLSTTTNLSGLPARLPASRRGQFVPVSPHNHFYHVRHTTGVGPFPCSNTSQGAGDDTANLSLTTAAGAVSAWSALGANQAPNCGISVQVFPVGADSNQAVFPFGNFTYSLSARNGEASVFTTGAGTDLGAAVSLNKVTMNAAFGNIAVGWSVAWFYQGGAAGTGTLLSPLQGTPVLFSGSTTATLVPGQYLESDPISVALRKVAAGKQADTVVLVTFYTYAAGNQFPIAKPPAKCLGECSFSHYDGGTTYNTAAYRTTPPRTSTNAGAGYAGLPATDYSFGWGAMGLYGVPTSDAVRVVSVMGDSNFGDHDQVNAGTATLNGICQAVWNAGHIGVDLHLGASVSGGCKLAIEFMDIANVKTAPYDRWRRQMLNRSDSVVPCFINDIGSAASVGAGATYISNLQTLSATLPSGVKVVPATLPHWGCSATNGNPNLATGAPFDNLAVQTPTWTGQSATERAYVNRVLRGQSTNFGTYPLGTAPPTGTFGLPSGLSGYLDLALWTESGFETANYAAPVIYRNGSLPGGLVQVGTNKTWAAGDVVFNSGSGGITDANAFALTGSGNCVTPNGGFTSVPMAFRYMLHLWQAGQARQTGTTWTVSQQDTNANQNNATGSCAGASQYGYKCAAGTLNVGGTFANVTGATLNDTNYWVEVTAIMTRNGTELNPGGTWWLSKNLDVTAVSQ